MFREIELNCTIEEAPYIHDHHGMCVRDDRQALIQLPQ